MKASRPASASRGQILIPALFFFPTLMLFVFLIFETAKLSREKIRHQFAIDSASFVEMTNYSDFVNRSAYVNGAFPMRIFYEGFHDETLDCFGRDPCPGTSPWDDILYHDGVFPRDPSDPAGKAYQGGASGAWNILYDENSPRAGMNSDDPDIDSHNSACDTHPCVTIISEQTAEHWNLNWEDANSAYKLFVQVYQLLGSVESAQYSVLKRLGGDHNFLKKSYWLNSGGPTALAEAAGAAAEFDSSAGGFLSGGVKFDCAAKVLFYGNLLVHDFGQPYRVIGNQPGSAMPDTISDCSGLFQLVTVDKSLIQSASGPTGNGDVPEFGWPVSAQWTAPSNYFGVDVNQMMNGVDGGPKVHATVSLWRGVEGVASVWPQPTPKFQVRLYP